MSGVTTVRTLIADQRRSKIKTPGRAGWRPPEPARGIAYTFDRISRHPLDGMTAGSDDQAPARSINRATRCVIPRQPFPGTTASAGPALTGMLSCTLKKARRIQVRQIDFECEIPRIRQHPGPQNMSPRRSAGSRIRYPRRISPLRGRTAQQQCRKNPHRKQPEHSKRGRGPLHLFLRSHSR